MSDHMLWAEARDLVSVGEIGKGYAFFGHPSMSTSIFAPRIDSAFLLTPSKERVSLNLQGGGWLPGFGHMEFLQADMMHYWPGDYVFGLARTPGVYDLSWHGGKSGLFLSRSYAKVIVHAGAEGSDDAAAGPSSQAWSAGFPLEILPARAPYKAKAGQSLDFDVKYLGRPVKAGYYASYWAWDEQGDSRVQRGIADEQGRFSVNLSRGGMWIIDASLTLNEPGIYVAEESKSRFYKAGDRLEYNTIQVKSEMTIWAQ